MRRGDGILCVDNVYGGTQRYLRKIAGGEEEEGGGATGMGMGINVKFADFGGDMGDVRRALEGACYYDDDNNEEE